MDRDWSYISLLRLGLLSFLRYEAISRWSESQVGGIIAVGRIAFSKRLRKYCVKSRHDGEERKVRCEGPTAAGFASKTRIFGSDKESRTFFICKWKKENEYECVFSDGQRERFGCVIRPDQMSAALRRRIVDSGIRSEL